MMQYISRNSRKKMDIQIFLIHEVESNKGYFDVYLILWMNARKPISWPVHGDVIVVGKIQLKYASHVSFWTNMCLPKEAALSILSHAGNILNRDSISKASPSLDPCRKVFSKAYPTKGNLLKQNLTTSISHLLFRQFSFLSCTLPVTKGKQLVHLIHT